MDYSNKFAEILNTNEIIIKNYKPNKIKYWLTQALQLFLFAILLAAIILSFSFIQVSTTEEPANAAFNPTGFAISFSICIVIWLLTFVYLIFFYRNLYYCITNERVIVRRGVFGTDFKTLDFKMIGAINVHVSLLDKIAHQNTGSIVFGSNSAPMINKSSAFLFRDILNPYDESKEIKTAIDNFQETRNK